MKKNKPNSTSGNEAAIKILDELLKLSPEELKKRIDEYTDNEPHWAVEALENAGYFDLIKKDKK